MGSFRATSAFSFEGNNQFLLKLINGSQCVPQQVSYRFKMHRSITELAKQFTPNATEAAQLTYVGKYIVVRTMAVDGIQLYGKPTIKRLSREDRIAAANRFGHVSPDKQLKHYYRFSYVGIMYQSSSYC